MQLKHEGVGYDANFKPDSEDFSIDDPTGLIIILRDKLYSDKLRVFMQEYISNARDANREVNKPDHEIEITAPTRSEPIFKVRDYGPGLSPERVRKVFLKFGGSTKRGTDQFIGGYGIGAKSGWAYTDSFVVRSFHQGTEYHYLCHLGETPKGSMSKLFEGPTTEPNGVEIQVQVQQDDINRSHLLLNFLTRFWPTLPKFHNLTVHQPKMIVDSHLPFEIIDTQNSSSLSYGNLPNLVLVLDGIPYALNCSYLEGLLSGLRHHTRTTAFVFRAKTGEIDVAANREQIEIDKKGKYKAWLLDKIHRTIAHLHAEHRNAAMLGLTNYVEFWRDRGRHTQLTRERSFQGQKEGVIDNQQLQKEETAVLEHNYQFVMARDKKAKESLEQLRLLIPSPAPQIPPIMTKINGFCWYFEAEKTLLVNETLYPLFLKPHQVYTRRKAPLAYDLAGRRKARPEMFQLPFPVWEGLVLDKDVFHEGLSLKCFDKDRRGYQINREKDAAWPLASNILFNDEPKPADKLAKLTNRIPSDYQYILDVTDIPKWMEDLGVKPMMSSLKQIVRYEITRVKRPSGSIRLVHWSESSYNTEAFTFGSYEEPDGFMNDDFFVKSSVILYCWTDESRRKWSPTLEPLIGRFAINEAKFVQLNKKAFKWIQETFPKAKMIRWDEWAKNSEMSAAHVTPVEYEQFAFEWLNSTQHAVVGMLTDVHKIKVEHPVYKEFVNELREAETLRGGSRSSRVADYFRKNRKILKTLKPSRIYQLRQELLRKYPMLPIVETHLVNYDREKRGQESRSDILNGFLKDPRTYMRTKAKQHGDAETWLRSKE